MPRAAGAVETCQSRHASCLALAAQQLRQAAPAAEGDVATAAAINTHAAADACGCHCAERAAASQHDTAATRCQARTHPQPAAA